MLPSTQENSPFICSICSKSYARAGHLRRHQVQRTLHFRICGMDFPLLTSLQIPMKNSMFVRSAQKSLVDRQSPALSKLDNAKINVHAISNILIPSCRDVCRRHTINCSERGSAIIPLKQKRGTKRRACDACSRRKVACDQDDTCCNCTLLNIPCTYTRITDDQIGGNIGLQIEGSNQLLIGSPSSSSAGNDADKTQPCKVPIQQSTQQRTRKSENSNSNDASAATNIKFLLNHTNPRTRTMPGHFGHSDNCHGQNLRNPVFSFAPPPEINAAMQMAAMGKSIQLCLPDLRCF